MNAGRISVAIAVVLTVGCQTPERFRKPATSNRVAGTGSMANAKAEKTTEDTRQPASLRESMTRRIELERRIQQNPSDRSSLVELAQLRDFEGDHQGAVRLLSRAVIQSSNDVNARLLLAKSLAKTGDRQAAMRQAEAILDQVPNHDEARALLGIWHRELGRSSDARDILSAGWNSQPRGLRCGLEWARLERDRGQLSQAVSILESCLGIAPNDESVRLELARIYSSTNEPNKAIPHWRWLRERGGDVEATYELARQLALADLPVQAEETLEQAIEIDPNYQARRAIEADVFSASNTRPSPRRKSYPSVFDSSGR